MLKKTKLEEFKDKLRGGDCMCMQEDLMEFATAVGIRSIVQHPDYENDIAYDIDDVLGLLELIIEEKK